MWQSEDESQILETKRLVAFIKNLLIFFFICKIFYFIYGAVNKIYERLTRIRRNKFYREFSTLRQLL